MLEPPSLDVVRGLGVLLALAGVVVSAPAGSRLHLDTARRRGRQLADKLLRRRKPTTVTTGVAAAWASARSSTARGRPDYPSDGLVAEQLEWLREQLLELEQRVTADEQALGKERQARRTALDELDVRLRGELTDVRQRLDKLEQTAAEWQARGIPLLAAGVVLTAVPDVIARLPGLVGWPVLVLVAVVAAALARTRHRPASA